MDLFDLDFLKLRYRKYRQLAAIFQMQDREAYMAFETMVLLYVACRSDI
jgi:hypothetical protein